MVSDNPETFADLDGHILMAPNDLIDLTAGQKEEQDKQPPPPQQTTTMSAASPQTSNAPQTPTMSADTNWPNGKQSLCIEQGMKTALEDAIPFHDEMKAVADSVVDGSAKPLKSLVSLGTATEVTHEGAKHVAESRVAQKAVKTLVKSAGGRLSANAVGKVATVTARWTAFIGLGIAANSGFNEYKACMAN
jgi:hypothetical protein